MNQHLSSQQISSWLIGERTPQAAEHVRECDECSAELARAGAVLQMFRGSVRRFSEAHSGGPAQRGWAAGPPRRGFRLRPAGLAWAAAVLMIVAIPLYRGLQPRDVGRQQPRAEPALADALLLEQVDAELSRTVPQPMEPLMRLVSWDPGLTDESKDSRGAAAGNQVDR